VISAFLLLTLVLSAPWWALIIRAGSLTASLWFVLGLMWAPGLAAMLTLAARRESLAALGWRPGPARYLFLGLLIPAAYATAVYVVVWVAGLGGFPNRELVDHVGERLGLETRPVSVVIAGFVLAQLLFGLLPGCAFALGEEIGWRGFLVPRLVERFGERGAGLLSGGIWAAWHYPMVLFADYRGAGPLGYGAVCFTVMATGIAVVLAWLRLRSGSLWPAALLHATHNLLVQTVFDPLTTGTGPTQYVIGEFGAALALAALVVGWLAWRRLPGAKPGRCCGRDDLVSGR
jgi:membrane protease YdiL (CAAX protease family)